MYNLGYKIVILGECSVSKSAFILRTVSGHFADSEYDHGEDDYRRHICVDDEPAIIELLEWNSQSDFAFLQDQWIQDCEGFFIFYSITNRKSFEQVSDYMDKEILRVKQDNRYPVILIGTKADMESERQVSADEGEACARYLDAAFFEVSAKTGQNVDECVHEMVRLIRKSRGELNPYAKREQRQCQIF